MPEQLRKILNRIVEWWKKFNNKQRALLISITAVVLVALGILAYVVSRPEYIILTSVSTAKEGAEVVKILDDASIVNKTNSSGTVIYVQKKDEATASMKLGENDIPSASFSIENVTSGSFSQTESDKEKLYQDYLEKKFAAHIETLENVKTASIDITLPDNDGTILSKDEQGTAAICLELKDTMTEEQAYGLAKYVATELGNKDTSGITIIDSKNNVLFSGADENTNMGVVSSQLSYQQKQEALIKQEVTSTLLGTSIFANVEVGLNLDVDYDTTEVVSHEYSVPDGAANGPLSHAEEYHSESSGGTAATPGTTSNNNTSYVVQDGSTSSQVIDDNQYDYKVNEKITNESSSGGSINYENSSISIVCSRYITYNEETLEAAGELADMTFDEYKAAHSEPQKVEVDDSFVELVANATGFSSSKITIVCYEQPEFIEKAAKSRNLTDILQIVLAVLIFVLLGYVVFRSTRRTKETEMEPELSVDGLLESTGEAQEELEDIGYSEKSETRILIEKFVDENPDAAALLLRNWLNDEWE